MLYKENIYYYSWNAIVAASAIYIGLYIPLNLVLDLGDYTTFTILYSISSAVFIADVFVDIFRFNNQVRNQNPFEPRATHGRFLPWFAIDIIAALPYLILFGGGAPIQLLKLVKLLKVGRFMHQISQQEVRLSQSLTISFFFFWLVHIAHWIACGWLGITDYNSQLDISTNYIQALYWTVTTLTTVGYGDILPQTNLQMSYAMLVQLIGFGAFGYLIGNMVTLLSKKDPSTTQYLKNIENLSGALQIRDLNRDLQKRILNYYNYLRKEKVGYDESLFLDGLPTLLKTEAELELKKNFIVGIPIFKNASVDFVTRIAIRLELVIITPGEILMRQGEGGNEMYFIISGMLDVIRDGKQIFLLKEGEFFGEMALVANKPRTATVKARSFCNLYRLERETFEQIISDFPEIVEQITEKAKSRGMPPD